MIAHRFSTGMFAMPIINSGTGRPEPLPDEDDGEASAAPEITRTSDRRKRKASGTEDGRDKPQQSAKAYAISMLARQDYSAATLRSRLERRGYAPDEIEDAMAFVIGNNYQNDERFAELRSRGIAKRAGNMRIEMTLRQKGIDAELAREQVRQLEPEEERVVHAAAKFRTQLQKTGMTPELRMKIYRFLAYRGFSAKAIRVAIESLGQDADWVEDV
jgi:regulatory protein